VLAAGCGASATPGATSSTRSGARTSALEPSAKKASEALHALEGGLPQATAKLPTPSKATNIEREYLIAVANDVQHVWRREFRSSHLTYRPARVVLFWSKVKSDCGESEDSGPFYCPADRTVYLDLKFFADLLQAAGVGSAAQAYLVGHEFGHHVQQLLGIAGSVADANERDPSGKNARSVKVELQADCLAGVWGRSAYPRTELTISDLRQALRAADVIGDDYLQQAAGNVVDSAEWTHGSSKQRQYWVRRGYESGQPSSCDTFAGG
jgi:predicted metalloprotease